MPLLERGAGSPCNNAAWAETYLRTKWHLDPSNRLGTIDMGEKLGALSHFWEGELGPHLTQCGNWVEAYLPTKWHLDPWTASRHLAQQIWVENWDVCPFRGRGPGPYLTEYGQGRGLPACQVSY